MKHCPLCGSYISKVNVGEAAELYNKGWSLKRIADKYGVTYQAVQSVFKKKNINKLERP